MPRRSFWVIYERRRENTRSMTWPLRSLNQSTSDKFPGEVLCRGRDWRGVILVATVLLDAPFWALERGRSFAEFRISNVYLTVKKCASSLEGLMLQLAVKFGVDGTCWERVKVAFTRVENSWISTCYRWKRLRFPLALSSSVIARPRLHFFNQTTAADREWVEFAIHAELPIRFFLPPKFVFNMLFWFAFMGFF